MRNYRTTTDMKRFRSDCKFLLYFPPPITFLVHLNLKSLPSHHFQTDMPLFLLTLLALYAASQPLPNTQCEALNCDLTWLNDGDCDFECFNEECFYDGGDCQGQLCGTDLCLRIWLGDGQCDSNCNNRACDYDSGDCDQLSFLQIED